MLTWEKAPKWGIVQRLKWRSERKGGGGGEKEREGAYGHSFDPTVSPPCNKKLFSRLMNHES